MTDSSIQRALAEQAYAEELDQLARNDRRPRPSNWRLSPWAVAAYVLGATLDNGFVVSAKQSGSIGYNQGLTQIILQFRKIDRGHHNIFLLVENDFLAIIILNQSWFNISSTHIRAGINMRYKTDYRDFFVSI